jgi:hypothetical protein
MNLVFLLFLEKKELQVHENTASKMFYAKGATECLVTEPKQVSIALQDGIKQRTTRGTNMNNVSSRSHSFFIINVKNEDKQTKQKKSGKLYLVELAGSESAGDAGKAPSALAECCFINTSLSALSRIFSGINDNTSRDSLPFRESLLTKLLKDSLWDNSLTTIILCVSPAIVNKLTTRSTLVIGTQAKMVKNVAKNNIVMTVEERKRQLKDELVKIGSKAKNNQEQTILEGIADFDLDFYFPLKKIEVIDLVADSAAR